MIKFEFAPPKTVTAFYSISFSDVAELKNLDIPLDQNSHILIALKRDMRVEELNYLTDNLDERMLEIGFDFQLFESLTSNILYVFN